jgi:hypothetical protein
MILNLSRLKRFWRDNWPSTPEERWAMVRENFQILLKTTGVLVWIFILILTLMEIKRYYNIDLIPGYDSSFEQVYGSMRGGITKPAKDLE